MSGVNKEWLVVLIFFLCFFAFTFGEAVFINRNGWASFIKGLAFSFLTNFLSFAIGFFITFIIFAVILAMAWDGSLDKIPGHDYTIVAMMICGALFPLALLVLFKRVLLALFKIQTGKTAWLFSIAASVLILVASIGLPVLFMYIF